MAHDAVKQTSEIREALHFPEFDRKPLNEKATNSDALIGYPFYKKTQSKDETLASIEGLRKYISDEEYLISIMEVKEWDT